MRVVVILLFVLALVLLAYLLLPSGGQRAVLLGSDARAGEASRSDTIVVTKAGGGMLAVPRDTLVDIPGVGEDKINAAFATTIVSEREASPALASLPSKTARCPPEGSSR